MESRGFIIWFFTLSGEYLHPVRHDCLPNAQADVLLRCFADDWRAAQAVFPVRRVQAGAHFVSPHDFAEEQKRVEASRGPWEPDAEWHGGGPGAGASDGAWYTPRAGQAVSDGEWPG